MCATERPSATRRRALRPLDPTTALRALVLTSLHPQSSYHTWVPFLEAPAEFIMRKCRERQAALIRANFEADDSFPRCAIEGELLHDGVVGEEDGALCNRKPFLVRHPESAYREATTETARVQALLRSVTVEGTSLEKRALGSFPAWTSLMDKGGQSSYRPCRAFGA